MSLWPIVLGLGRRGHTALAHEGRDACFENMPGKILSQNLSDSEGNLQKKEVFFVARKLRIARFGRPLLPAHGPPPLVLSSQTRVHWTPRPYNEQA